MTVQLSGWHGTTVLLTPIALEIARPYAPQWSLIYGAGNYPKLGAPFGVDEPKMIHKVFPPGTKETDMFLFACTAAVLAALIVLNHSDPFV